MHRFSCPVQVTSVHLRATSSVNRVVVQPSEGLFGDKHADGKTVMPSSAKVHSSISASGNLEQKDIDVDVNGAER